MTEPAGMASVLVAPDTFKGTAAAGEVAGAMAAGARSRGWRARELPLSDGGEGFLDVAGGANRTALVTGPLGTAVVAAWRYEEGTAGVPTAVIEMSQAAGLVLAGGPAGNDPVAATTAGVGELILAAVEAGAARVLVGCGGSATTDGGEGALSALGPDLAAVRRALDGIELVVACDVLVTFLEAAVGFGPQKGATPAQVELLEERLRVLAGRYLADLGTDVTDLPGSGAAGGLAGGLAAVGGRLVPGFDLVASMVGLSRAVQGADAVVTGEGTLDAHSFEGKVVGGVASRSGGRPVLCVAGRVSDAGKRQAIMHGLEVVSLTERFGAETALGHPLELLGGVVAAWLESLGDVSP